MDKYRMGYNKPATQKECDQANIVCSPKDIFGEKYKKNDKKRMSELLY